MSANSNFMISSSMTTNIALNIVLDTNMFVSGILYYGMIKTVFDLVLDKKLRLFTSPALQKEVVEKLQEFGASKQVLSDAVRFMNKRGTTLEPTVRVTVCRDPEDNFVLELAESSTADYIITRDKDLLELPLKRWKGTKIMKPEGFLPLLRKIGLL